MTLRIFVPITVIAFGLVLTGPLSATRADVIISSGYYDLRNKWQLALTAQSVGRQSEHHFLRFHQRRDGVHSIGPGYLRTLDPEYRCYQRGAICP